MGVGLEGEEGMTWYCLYLPHDVVNLSIEVDTTGLGKVNGKGTVCYSM